MDNAEAAATAPLALALILSHRSVQGAPLGL